MITDFTVSIRGSFDKKEKDIETRLIQISVALDFYSTIWEGEKYSLF